MAEPETIVVIGAGVLGLSAAICIQRHLKPSQSIVIVARDFPNATSINYATAWAGAHYRPVPGKTPQLIQEAAWAKRAYEVFQRIATDEPGAGVQFMPAVEYFENPPQEYLDAIADLSNGAYAHIASSFHRLSPAESGDDDAIKFGIRYWTYCVNSPVYCAHLLRKFILKGGQTLEYTLVSLQEAFSLAKNATTVVNCSGVGFADPNSYIIRGQTCLVRNYCPRTITRQNTDGTWSFAIPRPLDGGTVIGGTKQPHDWNPDPQPEIREKLLSNAAKWFPFASDSRGQFDVVRDIVGRRPARDGGVRLEVENLDVIGLDGEDKRVKVIHAYGVGGRGVELSWGIAENATRLLLQHGLLKEKSSL